MFCAIDQICAKKYVFCNVFKHWLSVHKILKLFMNRKNLDREDSEDMLRHSHHLVVVISIKYTRPISKTLNHTSSRNGFFFFLSF